MNAADSDAAAPTPSDFIRDIVATHVAEKRFATIVTRFPPEPNGYLHLGHAQSICLNFGLARQYAGRCNLRFDDTNPATEEVEYVESMQEDIKWLGFTWDGLFYASDYYEQLYQFAEQLIKKGKAYVDSLTPDEVSKFRGGFGVPGTDSPHRNRTVDENLDLFRRMKAGEFAEGTYTLRAKIDMASPNMNLRDPPLYRIKKAPHHRTGTSWNIYPMYDYAHPLSDALEGITHSICTLEFEDHRPLYDWCIDNVDGGFPSRPQQIEFARLNVTYTMLSKRKLLQLVKENHVSGWNDPRMPTIRGMRRRGITPESLRNFCERAGIAKRNGVADVALLEHAMRDDLNARSPRALAVLKPLKVVITNYPEGQTEEFDAPNHPDKPELGTRKVPFSRELFIEEEDFMENPPKKFFRLSPGKEVRLRYAYFITCTSVVKNADGTIKEVLCTYDPATRGGDSPDGRKVKSTMHWVSAPQSFTAEVRLYDRLFSVENPNDEKNGPFLGNLNPKSLEKVTNARLEPSLKNAKDGDRFQFERMGYFFVDNVDSKVGAPIFNRTVTLKDSWANVVKKEEG